MTHSCAFCRPSQSSLRRRVREYTPSRRAPRDIRTGASMAAQSKQIADRYAVEQRVRYERWLGLRPLSPLASTLSRAA